MSARDGPGRARPAWGESPARRPTRPDAKKQPRKSLQAGGPRKTVEKRAGSPSSKDGRPPSPTTPGAGGVARSRTSGSYSTRDYAGSGRQQTLERPTSWQMRVWMFLEEPSSSKPAMAYAYAFASLILCSVLATILQSVPDLRDLVIWTTLDWIFNLAFTAEVLARAAVCPSLWRFLRNIYNLVDIVAIVPFYLEVIFKMQSSSGSVFELVQLLRPVLRLLKVTRNFAGFRLLVRALRISALSLPVPLFLFVIMNIFAASLIYFFEKGHNPQIDSIPAAMWFSIETISTVGYGDVVELETATRCVVIVLILCGLMYMAMPLSIIGANFAEVWLDKDRILLIEKTKLRLVDMGYQATDVITAFDQFDTSGDGEIDFNEFREWVAFMKLGYPEERVQELFALFDDGNDGAVSCNEFARVMFPHAIEHFHVEAEPPKEGGTHQALLQLEKRIAGLKEAVARVHAVLVRLDAEAG